MVSSNGHFRLGRDRRTGVKWDARRMRSSTAGRSLAKYKAPLQKADRPALFSTSQRRSRDKNAAMRRPLALSLLLLTIPSGRSGAETPKAMVSPPDVGALTKMAARYAPVDLTVDISAFPPEERRA